MKMTDYINDMKNIAPSESFISETEKLMKAARDKDTGTVIKADDGEKLRRTRIRLSVAASAAAAVVCIAAVGLYIRNSTPSGIVAPPAVTSEEKDGAVMGTIPAAGGADTDTAETAPPSAIDTGGSILPDMTDAASDETTALSAAILTDEEPSEAVETEEHITGERKSEVQQTVSGPEIIEDETPEEDPQYDDVQMFEETPVNNVTEQTGQEDISDGNNTIAEQKLYTEDIIDEDDSSDNFYGGYGIPQYPQYEEECEEEALESDAYEDSGFAYAPGSSESVAYCSAAYNLSASKISVLIPSDEIYVPDSIDMLEPGTFNTVISSNYDMYDAGTDTVSARATADIAADDTRSQSGIVNAFIDITSDKNAVYADTEYRLTDAKYTITIYSDKDNEAGTKLFE
ncbi:MAG: hypothetical protein II773_01370, partial [Oscillospiraceae bacterium]|nr:hypothetical protein [Oscillospiraceae bacterium]